MAKMQLKFAMLTSAIGYGVFFPALIIKKQLEARGYEVQLFVVENLLSSVNSTAFNHIKNAFSKNFRMAQVAARIPINYGDKLDTDQVEATFQLWKTAGLTHFLCFSGLWLSILDHYKSTIGHSLTVDCCRVDAGAAGTWAYLADHQKLINHNYTFFNLSEKKINYVLSVPLKLSPYDHRAQRLTLHGGGWDLGEFKSKIELLQQSAYDCHVVTQSPNLSNRDTVNKTKCYSNDPKWDARIADEFPLFGEVTASGVLKYWIPKDYPAILELICSGKAIISKPGGMSLMDSLITETPLIFLEPMGPNEEGNQILWEALKLGISYRNWEAADFSIDPLKDMHRQLAELKAQTPPFIEDYLVNIQT